MFLLLFPVVGIPVEFGRHQLSKQKIRRWTIGRWYRRYFGIGSPGFDGL